MSIEPVLCECGDTYTYQYKARHLKSNRHINRIKENVDIFK